MKLVLLFSILLSYTTYGQDSFYSVSESGSLTLNSQDCVSTNLGFYLPFSDIAVTDNGVLYGITDRIYRIDQDNQNSIPVSSVVSQSGASGLVAIDEDRLIFDSNDSLFVYSISNSSLTLIGIIGFYCNGDFEFYNDYLYMVSGSNYLIRIQLNYDYSSILEVTSIGELDTPGLSYSLYTSYENCSTGSFQLNLIDGSVCYLVNVENASTEYICEVQDAHNSAGAASLFAESLVLDSDLIPNVFTPNNDGVNDYYIIKETNSFHSFEIFNRWGNVVYSWTGGDVSWDGKDRRGRELLNGLYFYKVQYKGCGDDSIKSGFIQLVR